MTRALVTGAAGQDGTILSTYLAREGVEVLGVVKPDTDVELYRRHAPSAAVLELDISDVDALHAATIEFAPDEIYNLGGISSIIESVNNPEQTVLINVGAVSTLLDAMRELAPVKKVRLVEAASGTIFEGADAFPQNERTRRAPISPYAQSKVAAMDLVNAARDEGLHAVSAILYNHESPLRGEGFVTRRITMAVARIARGLQDTLELGDIEVARDWGWAPDYVRGMQLMLRADVPHDYVLATEISHRLSFFLDRAFMAAGIRDWQTYVVSTSDRVRSTDTNKLVGDSRAAYRELGWRHTVDFDSMAAEMVRHDMALLANPSTLWEIPA
jgi:GDPmannose 4,6-dehydratase